MKGSEKLLEVSRKLTVDLEWIESIYDRMGDMEVLLDDDPLAYGPANLQKKIEQVRTHLSVVERVYIDARAKESRIKRSHRRLSSTVELATNMLLANDPHVMAGTSTTDRNARAMVKLAEEHEELHRLSDCLADIDEALNVVRSKKADLKDIASRLRDQMKLCSEQKWLGETWGSKRDDAPDLKPGQRLTDKLLGASQEELDRMINRNQPDVMGLTDSEVGTTKAQAKKASTTMDVPLLGDDVAAILGSVFDDEESPEEEEESLDLVFDEVDLNNIEMKPLEVALPGDKTEKELEREMGFLDDTITRMDHESAKKKMSVRDFATAPLQDVTSLIDSLS